MEWRQGIPWRTPRSADSSKGATQAEIKPFGWWLTGLLVVMTLLLINVTSVIGIHSGRWDAADFFCPFQTLLADYSRGGQWLLWTPLVNAGYPAGIDPQIGAFSPLTVGVGALTGGHEFGFRVYWLLIWGLGGVGIVLLARHFRAPTWAAFVAAVGFMFCGTYVGHAQHTCFLEVMSFFPWVLWRWDSAILRRSLTAAAQGGALWGLSALAGYPGMVMIGGFYLVLWAAGRLLFGPPHDEAIAASAAHRGLAHRFLALIVPGLLFLAVAVVVMSPTYVGFLVETRGYSGRADPLPRELATSDNALHPKALSTFASPYLAVLKLCNPEESLYPGNDASTCSIYLSPVLLILATVALCRYPPDRFRSYLAALGVLCLLCAMGGVLPLRGWLYDLLPPMRYFRHAGIFRCYYLVTVVVLALLASSALEARSCPSANKTWHVFTVACTVAMTFACLTFVLVCASVPVVGRMWNLVLAAAHLLALWAGMVMVARMGRQGDTRTKARVVNRHFVRLAIADAIFTAIIGKPTMYTDRGKLWNAVEERHVASLALDSNRLERALSTPFGPRNANLLTKTPTLRGYSPLWNGFYEQSINEPTLADSMIGTSRTWFSREAAHLPLSQDSFRRFVEQANRIGRPCLVVSESIRSTECPLPSAESAVTKLEPIEATAPLEAVPARFLKYDPTELVLSALCPTEGWILVTERWSPGWRATVNGHDEPIAVGNFVFRAVRVNQGVNILCFSYHPFGHPWLVTTSWATLGLVFGGLLVVKRSRFAKSVKGLNQEPETGDCVRQARKMAA